MEKKLYKSKTDRKVSGVLGGLAEYVGIDSTVIRLVVALSIFYYGVGFWIYVIAAIVMPDGPVEKKSEKIVERTVYVEAKVPVEPTTPIQASEDYNI